MNHPLTLELPDDLYNAVRHVAKQTGKAPEVVAMEGVARHVATVKAALLSDVERSEAMARLLRFAGVVSSGDPHSADNERIDADLAREYAAERDR